MHSQCADTFSILMARASHAAIWVVGVSTLIQPGVGEGPAANPVTISTPWQSSFTTCPQRNVSRSISVFVAGSSSFPLCGGPPAIAKSQNDSQISSHATRPSIRISDPRTPSTQAARHRSIRGTLPVAESLFELDSLLGDRRGIHHGFDLLCTSVVP